MIESIFIVTMCMGFVTLILAIDNDNIYYALMSLLLWIVILATHIYIQVPTVDDAFYEPALLPISVGFIFINVLFIISYHFEGTRRKHLGL